MNQSINCIPFTLLGLAALLHLYVDAINTPGVIPNVQGAWDTYVGEKFREAKQTSLEMYDVFMSGELQDRLPSDNKYIRKSHNEALLECEDMFITEVTGISTDMVEVHIGQLKVSMIFAFFSGEAASKVGEIKLCTS